MAAEIDKKAIAMVYQCVLCGSYTVYEIASLTDHEVELIRADAAAAKSSSSKKAPKGKATMRDQHAAEAEYMSRVSRHKHEAGANWLPCSCCLEHYSGWRYMDLIHAAVERPDVVRLPLEKPIELLSSPLIPIVFEDLPPVYRRLDGKWTLAEGVGPQTLEVVKSQPSRLPASQFKVLLKGEVGKPPGIEFDCRGAPAVPVSQKGAQPAEIQHLYREFLSALWAVDDFEEVLAAKPLDGEAPEEGSSPPHLPEWGKNFVERPVMCMPEDSLAELTEQLRAFKLERDALTLVAS